MRYSERWLVRYSVPQDQRVYQRKRHYGTSRYYVVATAQAEEFYDNDNFYVNFPVSFFSRLLIVSAENRRKIIREEE